MESDFSSQFPMYFTCLVGREAELSAMERIFNDPQCRLLTLTGLGGIGKTRLAIEFASTQKPNFPGGVFYISLSQLHTPELMVSAIADVLHITLSGITDPKEQLINVMAHQLEQSGLFVLDNMEHLLTEAPIMDVTTLLSEMLQRLPLVKFLVTSRVRLNLQGEWTYELHGLPVPPPIFLDRLEEYSVPILFLQNARRIKADLTITTKEKLALIRICHLLEGIPLALELAATWVKMLSFEEIADEIECNIDFLTTSMREVPERHRSLRATFDHSWKLLFEEEQDVFCRLSVFRGGFDRSAAEQIAGASLTVLASLVSKSLVWRNENGRYDLHEVIRQYSREQLIKSLKMEETLDRHFVFFLALAEKSRIKLMGVEQIVWLNRLDKEHDNLRAALEWSLRYEGTEAELSPSAIQAAQGALRLSSMLFPFWKRRSHWTEGRDWLQRALAQSTFLTDSRERADALNAAALLATEQADTHNAHQLAGENLTLSQKLGDLHNIASALNILGVVLWKQKKYVEARTHCEEGLTLFREQGDLYAIADTLHSLGHIAINQDDYEAAQSYLDESLSISKELESKIGIVEAIVDLGLLAYLRNDYKKAQSYLEDSLTRFREANLLPGIVSSLNRLGDLARCLGDYDKAGRLYTESLTLYREMGDMDEIPSMLHNLGYTAQHRGDHSQAMALFQEGLVIQKRMGNQAGVAECLLGVAGVLSMQGQAEKGAQLFGAAEALRESVGASLWPADRVEADFILARLHASLNEETLTAAWAEGKSMPINQAIVEAMKKL